MLKKFIYNLEFPDYINELVIGDYKFERLPNDEYKAAFDKLTHLVESYGSEYSTKVQTGSHQITAIVTIPNREKRCKLPWADTKLTQLDDILFLLTLFTGRNVFKKDWREENVALPQDHRIHYYGGQLHLSIKAERKWQNKLTGEIKEEKEIQGIPIFNYNVINVGFEKGINKVLITISSRKWQKEYEKGYFLFLFRSAIQRQIIETSFLLCWTIWEHIFAIRNRNWLDDKAIEQMGGDKKISFILNQYFLKNIDSSARNNIQRINKTRNRIVHFGKKTDGVDIKEMEMFIRLTEQLIAVVLNLQPSNVFNSLEELDVFLKKQEKKLK